MGKFTAFNGKLGQYLATLDLGDVLGPKVTSATRTFRLPSNDNVVIEDTWTSADAPFEMTTRLHTFAEVKQTADNRIVLKRDGSQLTIEVTNPENARLVVAPAEKYMSHWDRRLEGMTAIDIRVSTKAGETVNLTYHMSVK